MDPRVSTGHFATTSRLLGGTAIFHGRHLKPGRIPTGWTRRSSWLVCRSVFDASEGFPSSNRFPTTGVTGQDWRAFRAHLVAWEHSARRAAEQSLQLQRPPYPPLVSGSSWAHPLAEAEPGCLLLARRDDMGIFSGTVVLITSHNDASGSVGYILNKPSPLMVEDLHLVESAPAPGGFKEAFGRQRLHLGGPMHVDHVTLLHRFVGVGRCHKIADGIYTGGLADAIRLVRGGLLRPSDFQLVLGMSAWRPGQLRAEVADGFWHVISASPDLVLPPGSGPDTTTAASATTTATTTATDNSTPRYASSPRAAATSASAPAPQQHRHKQRQKQQVNDFGCGGRGAVAAEEEEAEDGGGCERATSPQNGRSSSERRRSGGTHQSSMYRRIARLAVRGA